jgi:transposase
MGGGRSVPAGQQVEVDDHEQIVERVAAVDVAKASGMVCTRVPHQAKAGKRITRVWQVGSTTNQILELAEQLAGEGIQRVVVESTSDYWRPYVYLLEARGLVVWLVNARDVKQAPGRPKTDKLDAVWLAKLNERGMLRPSFVAPAEIRRLRDYTRLRADLTAERSRHKQRLGKLLEDALIKLGTVATDIFGVSGRAMLAALIDGERNPRTLAELARGRLRVKHAALVEALTGQFSDHHAWLARMLLDQIDGLSGQIDQLTIRIDQAIAAIPAAHPPAPTPAHTPASTHPSPRPRPRWAAPTPLTPDQGAAGRAPAGGGPLGRGRRDRPSRRPGTHRRARARHGAVPHPGAPGVVGQAVTQDRPVRRQAPRRRHRQGQPYLKGTLGEAAVAAAKTNTFLGQRYRRLVRRIGKLKALVAVARSILVIVWHLLADPTARFHDLGPDYSINRIDKDRKTRNHIRQLQALGYSVTLTPAA